MAKFSVGQEVLVDRNARNFEKRRPEKNWLPGVVLSVDEGTFNTSYYVSIIDENDGILVMEPDIKSIEDTK